ncbi:MAG: hypothetical protein HYU36_19725 [Planctomycetes bacterium]|nr:hypothetical protein [Planctomycetota bacterium]
MWATIVRCMGVLLISWVSAASGEESRACWWLRQDAVEPIADLQNHAGPGQPAQFTDRLGGLTATVEGDAIVIRGPLEPGIWRFDYTTFDGQFDMKRLYVAPNTPVNPDPGSLGSRGLQRRFGDEYATATGPWEIYDHWRVPTARVSLDGQHVYTNWFDLPSLEDQAAGRVVASFALDVLERGEHAIRIAFAPFRYNTRAHRSDRPNQAKVEEEPNPLTPGQVACIAIGRDERERSLRPVRLKPDLAGKHPRLSGHPDADPPAGAVPLDDPKVQEFLISLDPDRGEIWEYSLSEESMASDNDMDMGKHLTGAARHYDQIVNTLSPGARKAVDEMFIKRAGGFYTFCVFQRNYHPTGYAQNHAACAQAGLLFAGLAFDGPLGQKWLDWSVALLSKRVELLGRDGSVEFMNEGRGYGLGFWQGPVDALRQAAGMDLATGPFFENEWRYAMHQSPAFALYAYARYPVAVPAGVTSENLPTDWLFDDCGQLYLRSDWSDKAYRARFWCGPPLGRAGTASAKRYNFAHFQVNQGSFTLARGASEILLEPSATRDYRKSATGANCILVNQTDQWGGGQVWFPRVTPEQCGRVTFFADGDLLSWARGELQGAYPPEARLREMSRLVVHLKPDHFLVFDRIQAEGPIEAEWRYHAAFIEPQDDPARFQCFGFRQQAGGKTPEDAFVKDPEARLHAAFLHPQGLRPGIGVTEMFFRWKPGRPTKHMRVVQKAEAGPLQLLSAFGPDLEFKPEGSGFAWTRGDAQWSIQVGPGATGPIRSDGLFTACVRHGPRKRAEIAVWGASALSFDGVEIACKKPDFFARVQDGKVVPER